MKYRFKNLIIILIEDLLGPVNDELLEARLLRRLEDKFQLRFDRLNEENKMLKDDNKELNERVHQLEKIVNKQLLNDHSNDVISAGCIPKIEYKCKQNILIF